MTRKSIITTALTMCIAAAMLTAPTATAGGNGHYDCSKNRMYQYKSRHINAYITQIYNQFDQRASRLVEEGIRKLDDNMGADAGTLHTIHAYYESYLSYATVEGHHYLYHFCSHVYHEYLDDCPRIFGRNISYCHSTASRMAARNVELRDQLAAALQDALDYK